MLFFSLLGWLLAFGLILSRELIRFLSLLLIGQGRGSTSTFHRKTTHILDSLIDCIESLDQSIEFLFLLLDNHTDFVDCVREFPCELLVQSLLHVLKVLIQ